jgi:acyl-CoA reductase-like NAD-dependent aldehyde dehydrogenase
LTGVTESHAGGGPGLSVQVVQAFDRSPITEIDADDAFAIEAKLERASESWRRRDGWMQPNQRLDILQRLAGLLDAKRDQFALLIAREAGKPLTDAIIEVARAVDGVRNAADELRKRETSQ